MTIKGRITELENKKHARAFKAIFQDFDDPDLWHIDGDQDGEGITWDQVEKDFEGYNLIQVAYAKEPLP